MARSRRACAGTLARTSTKPITVRSSMRADSSAPAAARCAPPRPSTRTPGTTRRSAVTKAAACASPEGSPADTNTTGAPISGGAERGLGRDGVEDPVRQGERGEPVAPRYRGHPAGADRVDEALELEHQGLRVGRLEPDLLHRRAEVGGAGQQRGRPAGPEPQEVALAL